MAKKDNKFLRELFDYAKAEIDLKNKRNKVAQHEFISDLCSWEVVEIYRNCTVRDGCLFTDKGILLSGDSCMEEGVPYFVNQSTGYSEDDYYGTMFVCVSKGTFVAIAYSC